MQRLSEYLKSAEKCRKLAAYLLNPRHRQTLQEMATAWDMLAEERRLDLKQDSKDDPNQGRRSWRHPINPLRRQVFQDQT